jgi:hypothetical protein
MKRLWQVTVELLDESGAVVGKYVSIELEADKPWQAERRTLDMGERPDTDQPYRVTILPFRAL